MVDTKHCWKGTMNSCLKLLVQVDLALHISLKGKYFFDVLDVGELEIVRYLVTALEERRKTLFFKTQ